MADDEHGTDSPEHVGAADGAGTPTPSGQPPRTASGTPRVGESPLIMNPGPLAELPQLAPQARQYVTRSDDPRPRQRSKPKRGRSPKRSGATALVLGGTAVVVVGALIALYFVGQNRAQDAEANFTPTALDSVFAAAAELPAGWDAAGTTPAQTPQQIMQEGYWGWVTVSDSNCAPIDFSLGLLVPDQGAEYAGFTTDQIRYGISAFTSDGTGSLQQLGRSFVSPSAAEDFIATIEQSLGTCTAYETDSGGGASPVTVVAEELPADLSNPGVAFTLITETGDVSVVLLHRENLVVQAQVSGSADESAEALAALVPDLDRGLSALQTGQ